MGLQTDALATSLTKVLPPEATSGHCRITVNGTEVEAQAGERLIDALNRYADDGAAEHDHHAGEDGRKRVPQVCYHPRMGPIQSCDTCMVEIDGTLGRACAAKVEAGMTIVTASPAAEAAQHEAFDRILKNHMLYCTVCDNNNQNCTVHNTTALMDIQHQKYPYREKPYEKDMSNPFYRYDPQQCILCGRCVEACQNVQVNETLSIRWEDEHPRVLWDGGTTIAGSSCVSCGHCVTVCPCNALMEKSMLGEAGYMTKLPGAALTKMIDLVKDIEPEMGYGPILQVSETEAAMRNVRNKRTKTVCTYCGVGCSYDVWTGGAGGDRHILKIEPGEGAANNISTCVKGKFGWDFVNSPDRLTTPLIRENGVFREASWEEALELVGRRFSEIKAEHGPDALSFISSSKCTNEESYLLQKLARAVVGTNNVDNCSRYCQSPATQGLFRTVGYGGDSGSITDIAQSALVMIVGANPAEAHPVLATRVKRAHKLNGQRLIVADLRKHEMARRADIFFRPNPGTDLVWMSAVTKYILDTGNAKMDFIERWVNGLEAYRKSLEPYTLEHASHICGLSIDLLKQVAQEFIDAPSACILWAMGVTQHCGGSDTSTAISNLLLVTGNYMRPGTGAYPLRGHNNVQGASDWGAMPAYFPSYEKVDDPAAKARYEQAWGVKLSSSKGLDNHEMVEAIYEGHLKAMYLVGEDMYKADANANFVGGGFEKLEFFVVEDIFFSATCQYADVVLPASPALEKDGTFTSTERRFQRLYQVMEPLGDSRPDWRIIQDVANRLGANWKYTHPSEIMAEAALLTPLFTGVTYERLEGYKTLQWPVAADGTDTPLLYTEGFAFPDGKARFYPVDWTPPSEALDAEFDLFLNNGRMLEHFHEGNMTYRVPGIDEETPEGFVEVSPELAEARGLQTGQWVHLHSRHGEVKTQVYVTDRVFGDQVFVPLNLREQAVNLLTGTHTDKVTHTPAYKETAVRMKTLPSVGEDPLPRINFRHGHPTPQRGVEVERKWKRADYWMPGTEPKNSGQNNGLVQIQTGKKE
ncbi:formate dehydrogenase subunit alpha [Silvibacterium dinghuense]|uniref:nitrate reductase (cytochrome) n=1 Tax=Silvibacterium dinghuense TaxID=1560006 RepID=A0A4Q1SE38_9BACT|nr:formate dehydrogenase subunit alpha [Silvibacterium dinghuense]RXS95355.1 formate dehydrogenase subunit alpha [Silvibacterium dinghuense]GGH12631.1 putative oxidoreductase YjgC [Silvibacterium dinghuense]